VIIEVEARHRAVVRANFTGYTPVPGLRKAHRRRRNAPRFSSMKRSSSGRRPRLNQSMIKNIIPMDLIYFSVVIELVFIQKFMHLIDTRT
jgi:hypothetical protein